MATVGYPKISSKAWRALRARASSAPTTKYTPANVAAMLGMASPDSARDNTVSPMKRLGLIDEDGTLTDRGNKWRVDLTYPDACGEILADVYPSDLATLVDHEGKPDQQQVQTWLEHKGFGGSNARQMAATYVMIAGKIIPEPFVGDQRSNGKQTKRAEAATKVAKKALPKVEVEPALRQSVIEGKPEVGSGRPNLHLDIQIHIPADATTGQIDQIFASMAKHLYGK
ncbi:hypothetical protein GCM10023223_18850 [Stackebrandtia albiflava]